MSEIIAAWLGGTRAVARAGYERGTLYLPNGQAPQSGEIFRNPELAWSLKLIAEQGAEGVLQGRDCQGDSGTSGKSWAAP